LTRHVHFLGICGYAVSGAALLAREMGYIVTGSDEDAYPPTTDILDRARIPWMNSHSAENLVQHGRPHLVVVGNQVREGNPEWEAAVRFNIPVTSEAEFYAELTDDRVRALVTGTHGKTTTASLLAHLLQKSQKKPGFRLGTTSRDFDQSARLGEGKPFVIEGDEYGTAPWDPRPKFLHWPSEVVAITRLELDHPDLFPDFEAYLRPFEELVHGMPEHGLLVLCADDPQCLRLRDHAPCEVITYGHSAGADWRIGHSANQPHLQHFEIHRQGEPPLEVSFTMPGQHNAANCTAALIMAARLGASMESCLKACTTFKGASRRFELVGEAGGVTVIDDYAHHPTEVRATIQAALARFGEVRVIVIHVPHTYSRTLALLNDYDHAFDGAAHVILGPIEPARERHLEDTVSSADVAARVVGVTAEVVPGTQEAIDTAMGLARPGDVVLCLSVRGFDDLARRLLAALEARNS
jgi:UDP-N-acetylmuramate: L-alanyl-gamma-D-glutamyl-meso-diaminopimelate ligase